MWDLLKAAVPVMIGPGGFLVVWLSWRHRGDKVPKAKAVEAKAEAVVDDSGISKRWKDYADQIAARLSAHIDRLEAERAEDQSRINVLYGYAGLLRSWIWDGKEPPPPDWPAAIDPASTAQK